VGEGEGRGDAETSAANVPPTPNPSPSEGGEAAKESGGLLSNRNFSKLNDLADQGSRVASWIRSIKRWFWGGGTVLGGGAATLANTESGTKSAFVQIVSAHPFLTIAVVVGITAIVVYAGVKVVERYLLTAHADGRYQPR
jgi:hypothetical protein